MIKRGDGMFQQERLDEIMKILKKNQYVTVEYLVQEIRYSPASIRRDLTVLEKQGLVTRSYGGVTLKNANASPFRFRQHSMKIAKNAISKKAAELVNDGDVVFLDGSSTTQYMGHFLTEKKNITVLTSNMILANFLSENGVRVYCTGGRVVEYPGILGGEFMLEMLQKFNVDIAFFSTIAFGSDGTVRTLGEGGLHIYQVYRACAKKLAYLCGSDKIDAPSQFSFMTLEQIDYFISDTQLPEETKKRYPNTTYICTK